MKTLSWSAGLALLAVALCVPTAGATTTKCQRTIAKASSQFVQAKAKALAKCNEAVVKNQTGTCPDSKATTSIQKASDKLHAAVGKTCGGADKVCGGDVTGEDLPITLGWPVKCPSFERSNDAACEVQILDCDDIATCLECIGETAVDQAIDLYYGSLNPSAPGSVLNKCQIALGKATSAFLNSKSKILQKCWDARLNGKHSSPCVLPAIGDGKYSAAITKAEDKKRASICKACGGPDKQCGTMDDLTPPAIGFPANCDAVTVPDGGAEFCGGSISDLNDLVDCVDCVTEFKVDCVDRGQVPQFAAYPSQCGVCVEPAPSGVCPTSFEFTADGPNIDLDTGFTGLAHDANVPTNGRITLAVSGCDNANFPCGECSVNGPLTNGGGVAFDNHRCQDQPWVECSIDQDCIDAGATGPCIFFFGAPLPLVAGGVSTCVLNEIDGAVSGTANLDDGTSIVNVPLKSKVHPTGTAEFPCPICERLCVGGSEPLTRCSVDADCPGGTCSVGTICGDGPRSALACTANGTGIHGDVGLDCPPNPGSNAGTLGINLNISTGTQTRTVSTANPLCRQSGFTTKRCLCDTCNNANQEACSTNADCPDNPPATPGICGGRRCIGGLNVGAPCAVTSECPGGGQCNRPGEPTQPNSCLDDTNTVEIGCIDIGGNEGECADAPVDQICSIESFRSCITDADCNPPPFPASTCSSCAAGQVCLTRKRPCFTDNGTVGGTVIVEGVADVPCDGVARPIVGAFFCVAPVGATAVNSAGGLPALGRVRIPGKVIITP